MKTKTLCIETFNILQRNKMNKPSPRQNTKSLISLQKATTPILNKYLTKSKSITDVQR